MSAKAEANYRNGKRLLRTMKEIDYLHRQIDRRTAEGENEDVLKNPKEVNATGRVWSF